MLYVNGSVVVPVIAPAQLSVAVGAVAVIEHSFVKTGNVATFGTGAICSFTVMLKEQLALLPERSVEVYVSVVVPTGNVEPLGKPAVSVVVGGIL